MKGLMFSLLMLFAIVVSSCGQGGNFNNMEASGIEAEMKITTIKFDALEKNLGQVREGYKAVAKFVITNTGNDNLLIQNVNVSCGCTQPQFDARPIRPGRRSEIEVTFDTRGRPGMRRNSVVVTTNTEPSSTVLTFICEVIPR